jgi:hypothetical protein
MAVPTAASKSETKAPAQTKSKPSSSKQNVKSEVKDEKDVKKQVEKVWTSFEISLVNEAANNVTSVNKKLAQN